MRRREFGALCLGAIVGSAAQEVVRAADQKPGQTGAATADHPAAAAASAGADAKGLTEYVASFVVNTTYAAIPPEVIELGKKSILDGFGLALAGTKAESGPLCLAYRRIGVDRNKTDRHSTARRAGEWSFHPCG